MKKIFTFLVILTLLLSSSVVFADSLNEVNKVSNPHKIITIGYEADREKDIFGNMSEKEIQILLEKKSTRTIFEK